MTLAHSEHIIPVVLTALSVFVLYALYIVYRYRVISRLFNQMVTGQRILLRYIVSIFLTVLLLVLFSLLVLRPQWGYTFRERLHTGVDLLILLDVSRSMYVDDVGQTRLDRAKNGVQYVAENHSGRLGLIAFAGEAVTLCPLTVDRNAFLMYLHYADSSAVSLQGTDIGAGFESAGHLFTKQNPNEKILLVVTDGEDHEENIRSSLSNLKSSGVTVFTASVGSDDGGYVPVTQDDNTAEYLTDNGTAVISGADTGLLQMIADETGGEHVSLNKGVGSLRKIIDAVSGRESSDYGSHYVREEIDRFQLFAIACIILLIIDISLYIRWKK